MKLYVTVLAKDTILLLNRNKSEWSVYKCLYVVTKDWENMLLLRIWKLVKIIKSRHYSISSISISLSYSLH